MREKVEGHWLTKPNAEREAGSEGHRQEVRSRSVGGAQSVGVCMVYSQVLVWWWIRRQIRERHAVKLNSVNRSTVYT